MASGWEVKGPLREVAAEAGRGAIMWGLVAHIKLLVLNCQVFNF